MWLSGFGCLNKPFEKLQNSQRYAKDGSRALYRSLMAMLEDTERHGDAVVWIDKTTGIFAIIDNCVCTERLARLRGYRCSLHFI